MNEREVLYHFAADLLKKKGAKKILDMACDDGQVTYILAEELPSAGITGVDIDPESIRLAKKNYKFSNLAFFAGDARRTEFKDASFDAIVSFHTVEHLGEGDQRIYMAELRRILRPDGMLVLSTPDHEVWKLQGIDGMQEGHIKELTRSETEELIAASGFRLTATYGQQFLKQGDDFRTRKFLNFLKRTDVFKLRNVLFPKKFIRDVNLKTQPIDTVNYDVLPLGPGQKASVNTFICMKN